LNVWPCSNHCDIWTGQGCSFRTGVGMLDRCYNSKLGLDYNSSKDLNKSREDDQLVKHKDTGLYLLLYIPNDYNK